MKSMYDIGDLVVYKVEYRDPEGALKGKPRPLIIISKPNSKGDYLAIAGSTRIHQWVEEEHILVRPDIVLGGSIDKPTIFPASKQILIDASFIRAQIGRIAVEYLETLLRQRFAQNTKAFFRGVHAQKISAHFIPGKSSVPVSGRVYGPEEMENLIESALDFWLTTGRFNDAFEERFAKYLGVQYVLTTNSGSSANLLAVSALTSPKLGERRLKPGDEVITVASGFPTTVNPIFQNRLVPVFVDVDIPTYNVSQDLIEAAVSEKTRAIMLAHTLGNPFDVDKVLQVAQKHNLWVIEDCCDALGSKYFQKNPKSKIQNPKLCGSFGHIATFSFYPAHHITMGEGGALATNDPKLKEIIASFRDWGRDCWCPPGYDNTCKRRFEWQLGDLPHGYDHKYIYSHVGYNLKLTDMQAAVGVAQFKKLPAFIKERKRNFQTLYDGLHDLEEFFILPQSTPNSDPSWFGFPLAIQTEAPFTRDSLIRHLDQHKIGTRLLFGGNLTRQPAYKDLFYRKIGDLPNSDFVMNQVFWVGIYPGLTQQMITYVLDMLKQFTSRFPKKG